MVRVLTFSGTW